MTHDAQLLDHVLRLADSDLILAQRLGEWAGHGPVLEEDIALTNVGLDLLGQARLWFAYATEIETRLHGSGRTEDQFAYLREGHEFRNVLICELPNGDYAATTARQFYFDAWHQLTLDALTQSTDERIAGIAAKALKEVRYHVERSADWIIRLGDGTDESHARMQLAVDALWMYTGDMFDAAAGDAQLVATGAVADAAALLPPWRARVETVFAEAILSMPSGTWMQSGGARGVHTEHLGHLLAPMQHLQRVYPGAQW